MGGFEQIFGGSAVYPSNQTYTAITLSANTNLAWPIESVSTNVIIADLIDVTPINQDGWDLVLPDATGGSTGVTMIINNVDGTFTFNLKDNALNLIVAVPPGTVWLIYLVDNTTQAGVWRTFQYGAQVGSVNVAAIAGSGLLAIGTSLNQSMPVSGKSSNYTAVDGDRASVILWQGAAGTLTLPSPSGVGSNWFINVVNQGSGNLTVSGTTGLIDGAASKNFTSGTGSAIIFTDGTNYFTLGYGATAGASSFDYTTLNCAGSDGVNTPITLSGGQLNRISYKCFGILTGTRTIIVPNTVQQYWINNQTTSSGGPWTLTVKTAAGGGQTVSQPGQAILYCDGTDVQVATSGITLPVAVSSGGTGATTASAARTNLGSTATGDALFTSASAAAARTVLGAGAVGGNVFVAVTADAALSAMAGGNLTGNLTVTGNLTNAGLFTANSVSVTSATKPGAGLVGIYKPAANQLGFSTNNVAAGFFDATQNLNLTHALAITQGGTGATTVAGAASALGDTAATANTLVQRTAGADVLGRFFTMSGAQDNLAITSVIYEAASDGNLRRMSLSNFNSKISPDSLSTASGSAPSYSARAWARVNSAGTLLAGQNIASAGRSALGTYFVTFTTAMADTNYVVVATCLHVTGNFIMAASEAETALVAKTTSQVGIFVGVPGAAADAAISVVIYR